MHFQIEHCTTGRIVLGENGTNDEHEKPETQPTTDEQRMND